MCCSLVALSHVPAAPAQRASPRGSRAPIRKSTTGDISLGTARLARRNGGARGTTVVVSPLTRAAAAAAVAPGWAALDALTAPVDVGGYNVRPQQVPSSAADPSLPTAEVGGLYKSNPVYP
jgi:hypothetical protein